VASGWLIQPTKQFYYRRVRYWWVGGWCVIPGINLQYSGGAGWEGKGSPPPAPPGDPINETTSFEQINSCLWHLLQVTFQLWSLFFFNSIC
jgi:hypothetical protein